MGPADWAGSTEWAAGAGGAVFSPCGAYRWWLGRRWNPDLPRLVFIGLNPSRADGQHQDPTLRRLLDFGRRWGFGQLEVLNLFARVAPRPETLRRVQDPVGRENDAWILNCLAPWPHGSVLWLGWGNGGSWGGRDRWLLAWLHHQRRRSYALARTATGQPRHPLYCASSLVLQPYGGWAESGSKSQQEWPIEPDKSQ